MRNLSTLYMIETVLFGFIATKIQGRIYQNFVGPIPSSSVKNKLATNIHAYVLKPKARISQYGNKSGLLSTCGHSLHCIF